MRYQTGTFSGQRNFNLFYQSYLPDKKPGAVLIIVHGLAEHSGRYMNLVDYFVPKSYAIYCFDQRGHGRSEGRRGYVEKFFHFVDDLDKFVEIVRTEHTGEKLFLVGHSIGGTISTVYAIRHQNKIDGLILSGAAIKPGNDISSGQLIAARWLSLVFPNKGIGCLDAAALSRDQSVVNAYIKDPLVYRGEISARLGGEMLKGMRRISNKMSELRLPVLIMTESDDRFSNPEGSRLLYDGISSSDKEIKYYEGSYHEIFNEPYYEKVLDDMYDWMETRLAAEQ